MVNRCGAERRPYNPGVTLLPNQSLQTDPSGATTRFPVGRRDAWMILGLAILTFCAFARVLGHELVWDDEPNLVLNDAYRGLSPSNLFWMFTTAHGGHYQPLSWLSFAVDHAIWGASAFGFHLTNLILHAATAALFYFVARELLGRSLSCGRGFDRKGGGIDQTGPGVHAIRFGALAAAVVFAVHPLRVESVAWATERRDVLSGAWMMLAALCYLKAVRSEETGLERVGGQDGGGGYVGAMAWAWVFFMLSLLSKATGMTLPVVLLILDVYPLRRLRLSSRKEESGQATGGMSRVEWTTGTSCRRVLIEKAVFAIPAMAVAFLAIIAQGRAGALWDFESHPLSLRVAQAMYGLWFYVWKTIAPLNLIPLYEQNPAATPWDTGNLQGLGFALVMTAAAWRWRRRVPAVAACWAAYVVMIAPMLGIAQSGPQVVADRYSYHACLPWALLAGGAWAEWRRRANHSRKAHGDVSPRGIGLDRGAWPGVAMIAVTVAMATLTFRQSAVWANSFTLWSTVVERAPRTGLGHANLATVLLHRGDPRGAIWHAREALTILPGNLAAHRTLGLALLSESQEPVAVNEAIGHLETAAMMSERLGRTDVATMSALGRAYAQSGRVEDALRVYETLMVRQPNEAAWPFAAGSALGGAGRFDEAVAMLFRAIELDPAHVDARYRLGMALERLGRDEEARGAWRDGARLAPHDPRFKEKLGDGP